MIKTCSCISEIACDMVDAAEGDAWEDWYEEEKILPKEKECCECNETIKEGERAIYSRGWRWKREEEDKDGYADPIENSEDPDTVGEDWTCKPCHAIRKDLYTGCVVFGQLREMIEECLDFDYVTGEYDDKNELSDTDRAKAIKEEVARETRLEELRQSKNLRIHHKGGGK